jgi:hypothetical protein
VALIVSTAGPEGVLVMRVTRDGTPSVSKRMPIMGRAAACNWWVMDPPTHLLMES